MKLIRYEWLFQTGEVKGFFEGLDDIKPYEYDEIDFELDCMLPCPPKWVYRDNPKVHSYFTEFGLKKFLSYITPITTFIESYGIMGVKLIKKEREIANNDIIWMDEYQAVV